MYTTESLILKKIDMRENDALFSIYTKEFGKMRVYAQGVKKEEAKLKGHCEPLSHTVVSFVLGKNGERLTHAALQNFWPHLRGDAEKHAVAVYITEVIHKHCMDGEKDGALWGLLIDSFLSLNAPEKVPIEKFMRTFEAGLLSVFGYHGETDMRILGNQIVPAPF